ncbi:sporulation inhibitor of replication protein SirA [Bacillus piscicola]|uniref:sporulation inhibitor of replication protein SirA n=1 Tax=Bacillus piscicola TaxID=1632684 RepID=UPI001F089F4C|nr:sporulation inhibitor of replication protein SirA [Bacillus piscicola]
MSRYQLVIIQKEIALQYYQSEGKLYRLFLDYHHAYEWARPVLEKQIRYITEGIGIEDWNRFIHSQLEKIGYQMIPSRSGNALFYHSPITGSNLRIEDSAIIFDHAGDAKEEWEVFDCLKQVSPCVFAVNIERSIYGWLKPLKVFSVL